jgi:hypothetical protein
MAMDGDCGLSDLGECAHDLYVHTDVSVTVPLVSSLPLLCVGGGQQGGHFYAQVGVGLCTGPSYAVGYAELPYGERNCDAATLGAGPLYGSQGRDEHGRRDAADNEWGVSNSGLTSASGGVARQWEGTSCSDFFR